MRSAFHWSSDVSPCFAGDDGSPEPNSLMVEGCNAEPCVLKPNEEIVVNVYFTPDHEVTKLTPVVSVESHGNTTGFQLPDKDGCKFLLGFCCPVKANETVRYHLHVDTPPVLMEVTNHRLNSYAYLLVGADLTAFTIPATAIM
ncbi:hypothetical protein PR048_001446 [Dryococelus australis]|uniref:MD-2-related lipid-recognition domain-containing protein n=1 Tax=Dryococelus australis TaxID=614101 RepID=A0ABQ9IHC3_9NEOP|nr:hypothetical protein PR048_001446 [Dryococelus australis]